MTSPQPHPDVVILGGGLAGLTLSLQLKLRLPGLDVRVIERRSHPVPASAHKVGESSVEIAAHYFSKVLGLESYLAERQLKKFGFRFFFSDRAERIEDVTELGASTFLTTPSYQIDRGIFENDLALRAREHGVVFIDNAVVRDFAVGDGSAPHRITYEDAEGSHDLSARWLVDASGRAGLLKRRLVLAQGNDHDANAVWFRIGERIDVDEWSDDKAWLGRCDPPQRWLSTNHLVGEGYWVWLIPLVSGSHSVGIVADATLHPLETMNTFEKAMAWLERHQPRLFRDLDGKRDSLQDFAFFRRFSYGCKQVFDGNARWALTGEAGLFLDPFYSPGGDFIAIANTFITELVARTPTARASGRTPTSISASTSRSTTRCCRSTPANTDLRQCRGHAGEGALGLHLLLGRPVPSVFPGPADRPAGDRAPAEAPRPGADPERAHAGVPAQLERRRSCEQPGAHARPGEPAMVSRAQPRPARRARRPWLRAADGRRLRLAFNPCAADRRHCFGAAPGARKPRRDGASRRRRRRFPADALRGPA
jgi:flavin-dependent dehydrogenase